MQVLRTIWGCIVVYAVVAYVRVAEWFLARSPEE
jgi:hypothetical protein